MKATVVKVEVMGRPNEAGWARMYFWPEGVSVMGLMANRGREPHEVYRPLVPLVAMVDAGCTEYDDGAVVWSRHAGCDHCPCSPGFIVPGLKHAEHGTRFDIHVTVKVEG